MTEVLWQRGRIHFAHNKAIPAFKGLNGMIVRGRIAREYDDLLGENRCPEVLIAGFGCSCERLYAIHPEDVVLPGGQYLVLCEHEFLTDCL